MIKPREKKGNCIVLRFAAAKMRCFGLLSVKAALLLPGSLFLLLPDISTQLRTLDARKKGTALQGATWPTVLSLELCNARTGGSPLQGRLLQTAMQAAPQITPASTGHSVQPGGGVCSLYTTPPQVLNQGEMLKRKHGAYVHNAACATPKDSAYLCSVHITC